MFQLPQFVWALRSWVRNVFVNFLHIDATDRSKISTDQKRFFIALSLYPLSFFANTPFKLNNNWGKTTKRVMNDLRLKSFDLRSNIHLVGGVNDAVLLRV